LGISHGWRPRLVNRICRAYTYTNQKLGGACNANYNACQCVHRHTV